MRLPWYRPEDTGSFTVPTKEAAGKTEVICKVTLRHKHLLLLVFRAEVSTSSGLELFFDGSNPPEQEKINSSSQGTLAENSSRITDH
ncbi:hypothetical protein LP7551_05284 [Roseibium album]|nr:hypothetical protein LP7551_05284 [Roseibium album]